jgi:Flp pilus assembly protein TadD
VPKPPPGGSARPRPTIHARGLYVLAQVLEARKDFQGAEGALREILQRDADDATALNYLGYMLAERGQRLDEAVALVQRALKLEPGNPSFLDSLGWAYYQQGKLELADPPLTEAAGKMPNNSVIQDHLGDLRFKQRRFSDAAEAWQRALNGDGESIDRAAIEKKIAGVKSRLENR